MSHRTKTFRGVRDKNYYAICSCYACTGNNMREHKRKRLKFNNKEVRNLMVKYKQSA